MSTVLAEGQDKRSSAEVLPVALAAMGVVFGDIGTSPLYTMKEVFNAHHGLAVTPENVLGVLSLVFWALTIVVSLKYVVFIMRADNRGEGGIMALTSLALRTTRSPRVASLMSAVGLFGAALFYGDGVITPAISVLSAVEGLEVATPAFRPYVLPISLVVLTGLFVIQSKGTARVGAVFGPVMLFWFTTLGVLGAMNVMRHPDVLQAINPLHAVNFFVANKTLGFLALGAIVLAITGGEALYADMGHFGRRPIKVAWFGYVFPALYLNYLGQGALILDDPSAVKNPFYLLVPEPLLYPMVGLSTLATIIASQAVISGAFSLTKQAVQLGYSPRIHVIHTSEKEVGQIYVPNVNWMLLGAVIALVLGFRSSSALASAYGIAVTLTMMIDTVLACPGLPGRVLRRGFCFFLGQHGQDFRWGLVSSGPRPGHSRLADDLEAGARGTDGAHAGGHHAPGPFHPVDVSRSAHPGAGDRCVHDDCPRRGSARAAAQPAAQQGSACPCGAGNNDHRRCALRASGGAGAGRGAGLRLL